MKTPSPLSLVSISLVLAALLSATSLHAQGSMTPPPGAPAATMKTLDQIEARKSVQSLSATTPYTISQPGSYYLTGNITGRIVAPLKSLGTP